MSGRHLVLAAFWTDRECAELVGDYCRTFKVEGSHGAVVTFVPPQTEAFDFQRTMERLNLAEINERPIGGSSSEPKAVSHE